MNIETTFKRYEKGPGDILGVTLKPAVVKNWANSLHICTKILKDLNKLRNREASKDLEFHKEDVKGQIKSGEEDRAGTRDTLKKCINLLDTNVNSLVNIHIGIKVQNSNVYESVMLGEQQH